VDTDLRLKFQSLAQAGVSAGRVDALARRCQSPAATRMVRMELAAALAHVAFAAPERTVEIYDAAASGWRDAPVEGPIVTTPRHEPAAISAEFWSALWAQLDPDQPLPTPGEVTLNTAGLGANLDDSLKARSAAAALAYPDVREAAAHGEPPRFRLENLARCPEGSLGATFHALIVDNGFDLEVLDRDALGLDTLPAPLGYLNARILQCHDLWHIVAGYDTTALHEVGISAFQLAQFGHGYSAMFLATVAARSAEDGPRFTVLMDVVFDAWRHGRQTPPLIAIPWPEVWSETIEAVRARFGIEPFVSPYPADLFEQLRAA
jgi:ubiquinone biosynthesis protein Coq4